MTRRKLAPRKKRCVVCDRLFVGEVVWCSSCAKNFEVERPASQTPELIDLSTLSDDEGPPPPVVKAPEKPVKKHKKSAAVVTPSPAPKKKAAKKPAKKEESDEDYDEQPLKSRKFEAKAYDDEDFASTSASPGKKKRAKKEDDSARPLKKRKARVIDSDSDDDSPIRPRASQPAHVEESPALPKPKVVQTAKRTQSPSPLSTESLFRVLPKQTARRTPSPKLSSNAPSPKTPPPPSNTPSTAKPTTPAATQAAPSPPLPSKPSISATPSSIPYPTPSPPRQRVASSESTSTSSGTSLPASSLKSPKSPKHPKTTASPPQAKVNPPTAPAQAAPPPKAESIPSKPAKSNVATPPSPVAAPPPLPLLHLPNLPSAAQSAPSPTYYPPPPSLPAILTSPAKEELLPPPSLPPPAPVRDSLPPPPSLPPQLVASVPKELPPRPPLGCWSPWLVLVQSVDEQRPARRRSNGIVEEMPYIVCVSCGGASVYCESLCYKCHRSFNKTTTKRRRGEEVIAIDSSDDESENKQNDEESKPTSTRRMLIMDENEPRRKARRPNESNGSKRKRIESSQVSEEEKPPARRKRAARKPPPAIVEIEDLSDDEEEPKDDKEKPAEANVLIPKRKLRPSTIQTVEIFSSPMLKPRKRLPPPPSLGECSRKMLNFIEGLAITKKDNERDDDEEEHEEFECTDDPIVLYSETVDLTRSDDEESDYEKDNEEMDSEEDYESSSDHESGRRRSKRRERRVLVDGICYLCNKPVRKEPCPGCDRVFHNECSREYGGGPDVICWECEEGDIVDDSELTEQGWDTARSLLEGLCPIKSEFPRPECSENENPFAPKYREVLERWRKFFDKTENINEDFERVTREIESEGGFTTSLENDLHKVFQHYTNEQIKAEALDNGTTEEDQSSDPALAVEPPRRKFFISQQVATAPPSTTPVAVPSLFPEENEPNLSTEPPRPAPKYTIERISGISQLVEQKTSTEPTPSATPAPVKKRITPIQVVSKDPEPPKPTVEATEQSAPQTPQQGSSNNPIAMDSDESESDSEEQRRTTRALARSKYLRGKPPRRRVQPAEPVVLMISDDDESDDCASNSTSTISPALNVSVPKPSSVIDNAIAIENVAGNSVSQKAKPNEREETSNISHGSKDNFQTIVELDNTIFDATGTVSMESSKLESDKVPTTTTCTNQELTKHDENQCSKPHICKTQHNHSKQDSTSAQNKNDKQELSPSNSTKAVDGEEKNPASQQDSQGKFNIRDIDRSTREVTNSPPLNILSQVTTAIHNASLTEEKLAKEKCLTPAFTPAQSPQSIDDPIETASSTTNLPQNSANDRYIDTTPMPTTLDEASDKVGPATSIEPTNEHAQLSPQDVDYPTPVFIIQPMPLDKQTQSLASTWSNALHSEPDEGTVDNLNSLAAKPSTPPKATSDTTTKQVESVAAEKDLYPCPPTIAVACVNACMESVVMPPKLPSSTFENCPPPPEMPSQECLQPIVQEKITPTLEESPDIYPAPPSIITSMAQSTTAFDPYPSPPTIPPRSQIFDAVSQSSKLQVENPAYPEPPNLPSFTKTIPNPIYPGPPSMPQLNSVVGAPLPSPPRLPSCATQAVDEAYPAPPKLVLITNSPPPLEQERRTPRKAETNCAIV